MQERFSKFIHMRPASFYKKLIKPGFHVKISLLINGPHLRSIENTIGGNYGKKQTFDSYGGGKTLLLGFALLVIALAAISCEQPDNNVDADDGTWKIYTAEDLLAWNEYVTTNGEYSNPERLKTHAVLMADISLEGKSWTPVGRRSVFTERKIVEYYYAGTFDGGGHTISNLKIDSSDSNDLGLFGYIATGGVVENLTLSDVEISGADYIGGIAGHNYGTIENCSVSGSVSGSSYVGGIVGYNDGTIENCNVSGSVSGSYEVGGIAGYSYGTISACYNIGEISGTEAECVGGIAGANDWTISACYNTGEVSGKYSVGGVVGFNFRTITACYNTGDVSGSSNIGGIVGENYSGNITACYWSGETPKGIGNDESASGAIHVDSAWDKSIINRLNNGIYLYNQENTDNICNFHYVEGNGLPKLESGAPKLIPGKIENASFASTELTLKIGGFKKLELILEPEGVEYSIITWESSDEEVATVDKQGLVCAHKTGTTTITATIDEKISTECCTITVSDSSMDSDGYTITTDGTWNIYTADGLLAWNRYVTYIDNYVESTDVYENICYVVKTSATLMDDITLSYPEEGQTSNWTPVGYYDHDTDIEYYYAGTFDGGGHTISNLEINSSDSNNLGLFGYIAPDGVVKNLALRDVEISGYNNIGGITGNNYGTIENCSVSGSVSDGLNNTGGIAGYNYGTISACYNTGTVSSGTHSISGIVGYNEAGTITACYNTGKVSGYELVGGIVGGNYDGTITACYNTGKVSGFFNIGGIAGKNNVIETITACYWSVPAGSSATSGIGDDQVSDPTTKVDGTWDDALSGMNEALGIESEYSYKENDDLTTKETMPLVIVKKSSN